MLYGLDIAFFPRSKLLLISWLQSSSAVILEPLRIKSVIVSILSPYICHDAGRDWGQVEKGMTEDEMAAWHHWLDGLESQWTPGVGVGQGGRACCNSWGRKVSDTTEWLIWSDGTTDWFQIGKEVHQGCILSPCLFNLGEIAITSDTQMTPPLWQKEKRN